MKVKSAMDVTATAIKTIVWGPSGAGKTRLGSTMPGKVLFISAESGLLSIRGRDIDYIDVTRDDDDNIIPELKRWDRVGEVYQALTRGELKGKYDSIVVDSITELGECLLPKLRQKYPSMSDNLKMYGEFKNVMISMIKAFRDIDTHVLLILQEKVEKDDAGKRFSEFSLIGSAKENLPYLFDVVGYLNSFKQEDGTSKRFLMSQKEEWNNAKDRSDFMSKFEEPDMTKIIEKVKTGLRMQAEQRQKELADALARTNA